jgi:hypothetical protein
MGEWVQWTAECRRVFDMSRSAAYRLARTDLAPVARVNGRLMTPAGSLDAIGAARIKRVIERLDEKGGNN